MQRVVEEFLEKMQSLGYSWDEIERCLQDKKKEATADDANSRSL
jgi:GntR family transcriptional regulator